MNSEILEKIKKLQTLADRAANEHEAALAASRVAQLCLQHNLDIGSVMLEKEETTATEAVDSVDLGSFQGHWAYLGHATKLLFDVGTYQHKRYVPVKSPTGMVIGTTTKDEVVFFGLKANVESALVTYQYLRDSVEAMVEGWISNGRKASRADRRSFRMGVGSRIYTEAQKVNQALRQQIDGNQESMAIVRLSNQLVEHHANKLGLRTGKKARGASSYDAFSEGYAAGGQIDIHGARKSRMLRS